MSLSPKSAPPGLDRSLFSVVIVTHNRRHIIARAILSALAQEGGSPEVVVVDDASTDGTARYVTTVFPTVRFHRRERAEGPSICRNFGMRLATGRWVVVLDDDDELRPDALRTITDRLSGFADAEKYPVLKFRRSDGTLTVPFQLSRVPDLTSSVRHGDFASVWNRELALAQGLGYPEHFIGAEGIVWIELAERYGLPTWADCIVIAHWDAGSRLSDSDAEVRRAAEHAEVQDDFVRLLKPYESSGTARGIVTDRMVLSGVYSLLAGDRATTLSKAWTLLGRRPRAALKLALATALPTAVVIRRFHEQRRPQEAEKARARLPDTGWE